MGLHEGVIYIQHQDPQTQQIVLQQVHQHHQQQEQEQPEHEQQEQLLLEHHQQQQQHHQDQQNQEQVQQFIQYQPTETILSTSEGPVTVVEPIVEGETDNKKKKNEEKPFVFETLACSICNESWTKSAKRRQSNIRLRDFKSCIVKTLGTGNYDSVCPNCTEIVDQVYTLQSLLRAKIKELKDRSKNIIHNLEEEATPRVDKKLRNKAEVDAFLSKYEELEAVDVMHHLNSFSTMLDDYDDEVVPIGKRKHKGDTKKKTKGKRSSSKKTKKEEDFDFIVKEESKVVESDTDLGPEPLDKEDLLNVLTSASTPLKEFMKNKKQERLKKDKKQREEAKLLRPKKEKAPRKKKERKSEQCELCGKVLSRACDMVAHMNMHRGIKPHMCVHCGKCFAKRENMYTHVSTVHQKVRSYGCTLCEKKFARKWLLEGHIGAKHNGIRPYRCEHCAATFSYKTGIRKHKKSSCPVLSALPGWVKPPPQKNYKKNKAGGGRKDRDSDDSSDGEGSSVAVKQELVPVEIEIENAVYSINTYLRYDEMRVGYDYAIYTARSYSSSFNGDF